MKLYENVTQDNYTEIKSYGGGVYDGVYEMEAIWKALGKALDDVKAANINAVDNQFIMYCDETTLTELEQWLYITPDRTKPLHDRRAVVAALMRGFGHIGEQEIIDYVGLFTTGSVGMMFDTGGLITVNITRDAYDTVSVSDAYYVLNRRIPAHLKLLINDNIAPVPIMTCETIKLYSISGLHPVFWDGEFDFDGEVDFTGYIMRGLNMEQTYFDAAYTFNGKIDHSGVLYEIIGDGGDNVASTITNTRTQLLAEASRGAIALPIIAEIAFGDGGVDTTGKPITPDPAQTALVNELGRYPAMSASVLPNVSRFTAIIPEGELGGAKISEAGLYDSAGNLIAVKNMPPKTKEADLQLMYSFDDTFMANDK